MIDRETELGTARESRRWGVVAAASAALLALGLIVAVGTSNPASTRSSAASPTTSAAPLTTTPSTPHPG